MSGALITPARYIKHRIVRDLLASAHERLNNEPGRPRTTVLRRAVSDAYYAVFHAICYVAAEGTIGWVEWARFEPLYRSIDHQETKRRLKVLDGVDGLHGDIRRISAIFGSLLEERHKADYDPTPFGKSKSDVRLIIALAEEAVTLIEGLPEDQYRKLAVHLIAKPRRS